MIRRLTALVALGLVLLVATPAVGQADDLHRYTVSDPRGDVKKTASGDGPMVAAPNREHGDIRSTTVRHGVGGIWVRMRFNELGRIDDLFNASVRVRTNTGLYRGVAVMAGSQQFFGDSRWRGGTLVERRDGRPVDSCTAAHRIDYDTNVIMLRIPRTCLGSPRWVRANAVFSAFRYGNNAMAFIDGGNDSPNGLTGWSPRLYR
jgi:hypothetical protein